MACITLMYLQSLVTNTSEQERVGKLKQEYLTVKSKLTTLPHQVRETMKF